MRSLHAYIMRQIVREQSCNEYSTQQVVKSLWQILWTWVPTGLNTLKLSQNCHHFTDNIFKCIFVNEKQKLKFFEPKIKIHILYVDKLVQKRHNSIANALELCLSCTNPSMWYLEFVRKFPRTNSKQKLKFLEPKFWRGRFGYNDRLHQVTLAPSNYGWPAIMGEAADARCPYIQAPYTSIKPVHSTKDQEGVTQQVFYDLYRNPTLYHSEQFRQFVNVDKELKYEPRLT